MMQTHRFDVPRDTHEAVENGGGGGAAPDEDADAGSGGAVHFFHDAVDVWVVEEGEANDWQGEENLRGRGRTRRGGEERA